jgi:hypothetical protein
LAFAHLALLIPFVLPADTFGPYTYTVSDGQATITDFDSTCSGNLSITNELGGCPVISIAPAPPPRPSRFYRIVFPQ